ncbi:filamentous hemagglutinin family protein [Brevundimonas faecalis]|uniref:filamentous haemagglutinin family protein n=1 Tax=Brevundimonas faecalis TaxID=947378 RepID=UPI003610BD71
MTRLDSRSLRRRLLVGASLGSLIIAGAAEAQNRGGFGGRGGVGANPTAAVTQAIQAEAGRAAQANTASQRAIAAFARAAATREAMNSAQAAARAAAMAAQSNIRNGLGQGGLQVAEGVQLDPSLWVGANGPIQTTGADGRTVVTVGQTEQKAILTWDSFNVGRETDLVFNQQGRSDWVALNRLTDASADPTKILGNIKADGSVYVINRNGVIFGGSSQVNVRNLVASTAGISDIQFLERGLFSATKPGGTMWDPPVYVPSLTGARGDVIVEAGARITTSQPKTVVEGGGFVALLGAKVENHGAIRTDRGQTILAAGDDFVLRPGYGSNANTGSTTRGLEAAVNLVAGSRNGRVVNSGLIEAAQGDISLVGKHLVQDGVAIATTSVNTRGTIHLMTDLAAADASVTLTDRSLTLILPELDSKTTATNAQRDALLKESGNSALDGTLNNQGINRLNYMLPDRKDMSRVEIMTGGTVDFAGGSQTIAQGGQIAILGLKRVTVADGAELNVSGVRGVAMDMASNNLKVNIQPFELRDSPLNREGENLKNNDIWIDIRDLVLMPSGTGGHQGDRYYTPGGLIEVGGHLGNTAHTIGEWAAQGGTINVRSNEIVAGKKAVFDISGGSLDYAAGVIQSTRMLGSDGKLYDLGKAPAGVKMLAVGDAFVVNHNRWGEAFREVYATPLFNSARSVRHEQGYTVGRDAGVLTLSAPTVLFDGQIVADVVVGDRQTGARPTTPPTIKDGYITGAFPDRLDGYALPQNVTPLAGGFYVGNRIWRHYLPNPNPEAPFANTVTIGEGGGSTGVQSGAALAPDLVNKVVLSAESLSAAGLGALRVNGGEIRIKGDLTVSPGGEVAMQATKIAVEGDITARSGSISLAAVPPCVSGCNTITDLKVAEGVTLDARGLWVNLKQGGDVRDLAHLDGGQVMLESRQGRLDFQSGALIDVSAGGAILEDGKTRGARGGDVGFAVSSFPRGNANEMILAGDIKAYGSGDKGGGVLTIAAGGRAITIGDAVMGGGDTLTGGEPAPIDLQLLEDVTLKAGGILPFDYAYTIDHVAAGKPLPTDVNASIDSPITLSADWVVPEGFEVYDSDYNIYYGGNVLPAGLQIEFGYGTLPKGYVVDATVWPDGMTIPPMAFTYKKGDVLVSDLTLTAGRTIAAGTVLPSDAKVAKPLHLDRSLFQSGFGRYDVTAGGDMLVSGALDVATPVRRITDASTSIRSGADPEAAMELWLPDMFQQDAVNGRFVQRQGAGLNLRAYGWGDRNWVTGYGNTISDPQPLGSFVLKEGASIRVDDGQSVNIVSGDAIRIDGRIEARGGKVSLAAGPAENMRRDQPPPVIVYDAGRSIWLGEKSVIDVSGRAINAVGADGLRYGHVSKGGDISVGGVLSAYVVVRPGAVLDASGAATQIDYRASTLNGGNASSLTLASDGGSISFASQYGVYLDGNMRAHAGGAGASGGTLSIALSTPFYMQLGNMNGRDMPDFMRRLRNIVLTETGGSGLSRDLQFGDCVTGCWAPGQEAAEAYAANEGLTNLVGQARIGVDQIKAGGFGSLTLETADVVVLDGAVNLNLARNLKVTAGAVGLTDENADASLSAAYVKFAGGGDLAGFNMVRFENGFPSQQKVALLGDATLKITGGLVDLGGARFGVNGSIGLSGNRQLNYEYASPKKIDIHSRSDIRMTGGDVVAVGDMSLTAAQVYPLTGVTSGLYAGIYAYRMPAGGMQYRTMMRGGSISFHKLDGVTPSAPLSLYGSLQVGADIINQGGVLRAPLGSITLGAGGDQYVPGFDNARPDQQAWPNTSITTTEVNLLPGSLTSASAKDLVIPYGGTTDGLRWLLNGVERQGGLLHQGVTVLGSLRADQGSVLDLSGGGTPSGAGFIPGRGGSVDILKTALANVSPAFAGLSHADNQVYAIVPGYAGSAAPTAIDGHAQPGVGQQIVIPEGVNGLAAGVYTLLPAEYALMKGAFRVELGANVPAGAERVTRLADGSTHLGVNTGFAHTDVRNALKTEAILTPADVVRTYSQYNETSFGDFLLKAPASALFNNPLSLLPQDGKIFLLALVSQKEGSDRPAFSFKGTGRFDAAEGGVGGALAVTGGNYYETGKHRLEILADGQTGATGSISIHASDLNAVGAKVMTLGGVAYRETAGGLSEIKIVAGGGPYNARYTPSGFDSIVVRQGAVLSGPQVLLVADRNADITVETGAQINTLGKGKPGFDSTMGYTLRADNVNLLAVGNGLLEFTTGAASAGSTGVIRVQDGASLYSDGSLSFVTQAGVELGENVNYGARYLGFSSAMVNIGDSKGLADAAADGVLPAGIALNQAVLDRLMRGDQSKGAPKLERLILSASQSVNFYGSISLDTRDATTGKSNLQLVLNTPALYGRGGADDVAQITTGTLVWNGVLGTSAVDQWNRMVVTGLPGAPVAGGAGTGLGRLNLVADRIVLGYQDDVAVSATLPLNRLALGFSSVNLSASQRIEANHVGELAVYQSQAEYGKPGQGGVLNISTPLLTGQAGSKMHYRAGDQINLTAPAGAGTPADTTKAQLGAEIRMTAGAINADIAIALPSGRLVMTATQGDIVLGDRTRIDMSGKATKIFDETRYGWGGDVELESADGDVRMGSGAVIDLSADYNHAGSLKVTAVNGTATLDGRIDGASRNGGKPTDGSLRNGSIDIRANVISDFAQLNRRLTDSNVTDSRTFIIKSGDLVVGDEVKARQVVIAADGGDLTVTGRIDAAGHRPGSIRLSARDDLTLASTARLDASADKLVIDSYGAPVEASNRGNIELTSAGGTLTLASGATLDLSSPDGVARGRVELNAPRIGGDDIAIDARGQLNIRGADSLSVNGFRTYEIADGVINQGLMDGVHQDNKAFIDAAIANQALLARVEGLRAYKDAFHLRPGVELVSAPGKSLTVSGDLNLAGYRYTSLNAKTQQTGVYGSGEAGVLLIRAADDLDIHGSITDGFGQPARTPDDNGWVLYSTADAGGINAWPQDHQLSAPARLAAGTSFDKGVTLTFDVTVENFNVHSNTLIGAEARLSTAVTLSQDWVATSAIRLPDGTVIQKGAILKAGMVLPADAQMEAGAMFPMPITLKAMTWPRGVKLPGKLTLAATAQLQVGDVIPRNTNVIVKGLVGLQTEPVVLDKAYTLIGGAGGSGVTTIKGGADSKVVLDFDIEVRNFTTVRTGVYIPFGFVATNLATSRSGPWTVPVDIWASKAAFDAGEAPVHRQGDVIRVGQFVRANTYWGAGAVIPTLLGDARSIAPTVVPAGTPMSVFSTDVSLNSNVMVKAGTVIPAGVNLQLQNAGGPQATRPTQADGTQGRIWAVAPMLAPGSQSWSMRLVAGADIASSDGRTLRAATDLARTGQSGDLTLSDRHYLNPQATTDGGLTTEWLSALRLMQNFSVIRTGTGSLDLLAGGGYNQMSLYGVYTAGTQSAEIGGQTADGYNVYNQPRAKLAGSSGLANPWIGLHFDDYAAAIQDYQAWYPEHGGDLLLAVQGDLTSFSTGRDSAMQRVGSGSVSNWLWRQGGYGVSEGVAARLGQDTPTAWWINFGGYVPNNASSVSTVVNYNAPVLEGFMGIGALGGGNLTVRAGGDAGVHQNWGISGEGISESTKAVIASSALNFAIGATGRVTSVVRTDGVVTSGTVVQTGGGDMDIRLGGTLNLSGGTSDLSGSVANLRGDISILASSIGSMTSSLYKDRLDPRLADPTRPSSKIVGGGLTVIIGDGDVRLDARKDVVLLAVGDPGSLTSSAGGVSLGYIDANGTFVRPDGLTMRSSFSLWHDSTSISLFAAGGDVTPIVRPAESAANSINAGVRDGRYWYPPILKVTAAEGSILWNGDACGEYNCNGSVGIAPLELAPSPLGQLEFLAGTSILGGGYRATESKGDFAAGQMIAMSGMSSSLDLLPNPFRPAWTTEFQRTPSGAANPVLPFNGNTTQPGTLLAFQKDDATGTLIKGRKKPALFYAADGDISNLNFGFITFEGQNQRYVSSGAVMVRASRDIVNFGTGPALGCSGPVAFECSATAYLFGVANMGGLAVHNDKADISLISAGRDIIYANMSVAGPGNLVVEAGRNIYQADKGRFTSIGPLFDLSPSTRNGGAGISVMTGIGAGGPNYDALAKLYLDPANLAEAGRPLADQPGKVAKTYDKELIAWLEDRFGYKAADAKQALTYYDALDPLQRAVFARSVYFDELKAGGREYNDAAGPRFGSYLRGRNAIAVMFPEKDAQGRDISYQGDLTMFGPSGVRTLFGGDIQLLVAGGQTLVGVGGIQPPATAGVLSMGSGDIDVYSLGSVLLGQSRVFTTFGGDLFMWSAEGDINAGRGSKSTAVYQPPRRVYDLYGNVTLSPPTMNTGAGIATLAPIPEIPAGDVDLIAPLGTIDAGEAGIRVSGNVNLAALQVVNAANIQVKGDATGIPVVAAVNTGALTAASSATSSVVAEAARLAERARPKPTGDIPAIITSRFLGFGE